MFFENTVHFAYSSDDDDEFLDTELVESQQPSLESTLNATASRNLPTHALDCTQKLALYNSLPDNLSDEAVVDAWRPHISANFVIDNCKSGKRPYVIVVANVKEVKLPTRSDSIRCVKLLLEELRLFPLRSLLFLYNGQKRYRLRFCIFVGRQGGGIDPGTFSVPVLPPCTSVAESNTVFGSSRYDSYSGMDYVEVIAQIHDWNGNKYLKIFCFKEVGTDGHRVLYHMYRAMNDTHATRELVKSRSEPQTSEDSPDGSTDVAARGKMAALRSDAPTAGVSSSRVVTISDSESEDIGVVNDLAASPQINASPVEDHGRPSVDGMHVDVYAAPQDHPAVTFDGTSMMSDDRPLSTGLSSAMMPVTPRKDKGKGRMQDLHPIENPLRTPVRRASTSTRSDYLSFPTTPQTPHFPPPSPSPSPSHSPTKRLRFSPSPPETPSRRSANQVRPDPYSYLTVSQRAIVLYITHLTEENEDNDKWEGVHIDQIKRYLGINHTWNNDTLASDIEFLYEKAIISSDDWHYLLTESTTEVSYPDISFSS
ncbi:hypothetical protein FISHEDRAFT_62468 [Fistulina hepatica ATCC 64428]|nr:hypothetical protein FISHEDRAFT_62468 [Fistulina hepatica ATCC 64428]